jgi:RHS repeat-associated protein
MTQMAPSGTAGAPSLSVTVALNANNVPTNRINATGVAYDNNGNQTLGFSLQMIYDAANRVSAVGNGSFSYYAYDSDNRRIYSRNASGNETIYFYGADGTKLATYTYAIITYNGNPEIQLTQQSQNIYFLGKLISAENYSVQTDRLGSVRSGGPGGLGYQAQYPCGVEYTATVNDREKYATYTRDSATGLDYAMNRYYSSQWGRFLSPDPRRRSVSPRNPQSWNRYAYMLSDPVNGNDPSGMGGPCDPYSGGSYEGSAGAANCDYDASTPSTPTNPYGVTNSQGLAVNTGSMLGNWSSDLTSALAAYVNALVSGGYGTPGWGWVAGSDPAAILTAYNVGLGLPEAANLVSTIPTCAGLFSLPAGVTWSSLMSNFTLVFSQLGEPDTFAEEFDPTDADNPYPGHFVVVFNTDVNNVNIASGPTEAANTIIHESLHVAFGLYGPGAVTPNWINNDGNSAAAEANNNQIVQSNCFP